MKQQKFKIENNIPIPSVNGKKGSMYPFLKLKVGQSFFVKGKKANNLSSRACEAAKRGNSKFKFVCRTLKGGTRVWRIT